MSNYIDLITRLEAATGPSRELDARIFAEFEGRDIVQISNALFGRNRKPPHDECFLYTLNERGNWAPGAASYVPKFTAYIEAALIVTDKLLPDCGVAVGHPIPRYQKGWWAEIFRERRPTDEALGREAFQHDGQRIYSDLGAARRLYAANGAIAVITATIRAMQSREIAP